MFWKKKKEPRPETVERIKEIARKQQITESRIMEDFPIIKTKEEIEEEKWEQRRWELTRYLVAQERRSVVLGKLNASVSAMARKARQLADATIHELRTVKPDSDGKAN